MLESGAARINFSPVLEAGEHRKIVVEWPEEQPWRVCLFYAPELEGLNALSAKGRIAWHTRRTFHWRSRVWDRFDGVTSKEVTK